MDERQFTQRVMDSEHRLFRIAYTILHNEQDCADALQEALVKAWTKIGSLRQPQYFETWLVRILINECNHLHRRRYRWRRPEERPYAPPENQALHDAIANLSATLRLPVMLHYLEGYAVDEVAIMLSIPSGTVKSRLFHGRKELRAYLESEADSRER